MQIALSIASRRGRRENLSLTSPLIGLIETPIDRANLASALFGSFWHRQYRWLTATPSSTNKLLTFGAVGEIGARVLSTPGVGGRRVGRIGAQLRCVNTRKSFVSPHSVGGIIVQFQWLLLVVVELNSYFAYCADIPPTVQIFCLLWIEERRSQRRRIPFTGRTTLGVNRAPASTGSAD